MWRGRDPGAAGYGTLAQRNVDTATVRGGEVPGQPPTWVSAISRFFDGPRRIAHVVLGDE